MWEESLDERVIIGLTRTFIGWWSAYSSTGFKKIDFITDVSIPNNGVIEVGDRYQKISYKVNWNVDTGKKW